MRDGDTYIPTAESAGRAGGHVYNSTSQEASFYTFPPVRPAGRPVYMFLSLSRRTVSLLLTKTKGGTREARAVLQTTGLQKGVWDPPWETLPDSEEPPSEIPRTALGNPSPLEARSLEARRGPAGDIVDK